jgi:plasmid maintenance system antidote protein VapI
MCHAPYKPYDLGQVDLSAHLRWVGSARLTYSGNIMTTIPIPARILAGDFAGWLRDAMAARRLSTRGLAARSGIDHSTICRLTHGEREPSLSTAVAILKVLGTEPPRFSAADATLQVAAGAMATSGIAEPRVPRD